MSIHQHVFIHKMSRPYPAISCYATKIYANLYLFQIVMYRWLVNIRNFQLNTQLWIGKSANNIVNSANLTMQQCQTSHWGELRINKKNVRLYNFKNKLFTSCTLVFDTFLTCKSADNSIKTLHMELASLHR